MLVVQSVLWGRTDVCGFTAPAEECASNNSLVFIAKNCFKQQGCEINYMAATFHRLAPCTADFTQLFIDYICVPSKYIDLHE